MSQQLLSFAQRCMRQVDEGVPAARKIILSGEGQVFEKWEPVTELDPQQWVLEAVALKDALAEELPKRRCQLTFTAEDTNGNVLSTCILSVTGKNQAIQDLGTQNGAKALAEAFASVVKTSETVLAQARNMMDWQAAQLERYGRENLEFVELFQALQKADLEQGEQSSAASQILVEQLRDAGPLLMALGQAYIQKMQSAPAKVATSAVGAAVNGKAVT